MNPALPQYRAILVEDELRTRHMLEEMIEQKVHVADVELLASCSSVQEAITCLHTLRHPPDIAFLDIDLPDGPVFDLLEAVSPIQFEIIFITAYDEFARKACNYASIAYLNKPISEEMLNKAIERAATYKGRHIGPRVEQVIHYTTRDRSTLDKITFSTQNEIYVVPIDEVVRMVASGNYTEVILKNGKDAYRTITLSHTIGTYEDMLSPHGFFRTHRAHLINLNYVYKMVRADSTLLMRDGAEIPVARRRRNDLLNLLASFSRNGTN